MFFTIVRDIQQIIARVQRCYLIFLFKRFIELNKLFMFRMRVQLKMEKVILRVLIFEKSVVGKRAKVGTIPTHMLKKR